LSECAPPPVTSHRPVVRAAVWPQWVHEIKYDGYRLMARRGPVCMRLLTRNGHDWAPRHPLIVEAVNVLRVRSCLIDGEAVVCDDNGLAVRLATEQAPRPARVPVRLRFA